MKKRKGRKSVLSFCSSFWVCPTEVFELKNQRAEKRQGNDFEMLRKQTNNYVRRIRNASLEEQSDPQLASVVICSFILEP